MCGFARGDVGGALALAVRRVPARLGRPRDVAEHRRGPEERGRVGGVAPEPGVVHDSGGRDAAPRVDVQEAREEILGARDERLGPTWVGKGGFNVTSTCCFSDEMCQGKGPLVENSTRDDLSSKNESKRVKTDRDTSLKR